MAWVSDPQRQCDICNEVTGPKVKKFKLSVSEVADDGKLSNTNEIEMDCCPRCKTRLDSCIKTGTGPRTKGQEKPEAPAVAPPETKA